MPIFPTRLLVVLVLPLLFAACKRNGPDLPPHTSPQDTATTPPSSGVPSYTVEVVRAYRHDTSAFTQGLLFHNGALYESTGLNGKSSLRRVALESGVVEKKIDLPGSVFAEGLTLVGNHLYQVTWRNSEGYVYDVNTFAKQRSFSYYGEGWGLATDGHQIYMSDGSNYLRVLDPDSLKLIRKIGVYSGSKPITRLNELEMVEGELYANIWQEDMIARIDPSTGNLLGVIDLRGLLKPEERTAGTDVLNGIAYDPATKRLWVTGKNWPTLFEVRVKPTQQTIAVR